MKKTSAELIKCVSFGVCTFFLAWGLLAYASNIAGREVLSLLSLLSSMTMAAISTIFFFAARNFARIAKSIHRKFKNKVYGYSLPATIICISTFAAGAIMWKLTSVFTGAPISLATLFILSGAPAILGTLFVCSYRAWVATEVQRKSYYVGPVRGDAILFLTPAVSSEGSDVPKLVLSPVSLWDCYQASSKKPDIGLPEENALRMACREVSVFMDIKQHYTRDRLAAAIRAGGWVGAIESDSKKEMITQIYRKCCNLNEDEVVNLSQEEIQFISEHGEHTQ